MTACHFKDWTILYDYFYYIIFHLLDLGEAMVISYPMNVDGYSNCDNDTAAVSSYVNL